MYKDTLSDLLNNRIETYELFIQEKDLSEEEIHKYQICIDELNRLHKQIIFNASLNHPVFELLSDNHLKYNTEFQFIDGTSTYVENNQMCSINDNYLTVHEVSEDKTIIPPVNQIINLSNVKMVQVEYTPEITYG